MPDWRTLREGFPALREWTYLNTATYGQTPLRAQAAMREHMERRDRLACSDFLNWFDDADAIRRNLGRLTGCHEDDIAFLPTASAALGLLIGGIDWKPGDRVVTLRGEFPNNLYYPAMLPGVEFVACDWADFRQAVNDRTRLVALSTVNYSTGFRAPVEEIAEDLRRRGILFYVDGTQSVGALRIDVGAMRPSMMAVDAYKWMLTPNGAGFVYVDPEVRDWLRPNCIGWRSHVDWRSVDNLHQGAPVLSARAEKYEGGMLPFPAMCAMNAVIETMLEIGPERIERRVLELADELRARLRRRGALILHEGSQIVAARFDGVDASDLALRLKERRVLVSARYGALRVSPHFYNDETDLDVFERALD